MKLPSATHERFSAAVAAHIDAARHELAARWLDRLTALIPVGPNDVFPTDTLLDHIPALIQEIGKFIAAPEQEIAGNTVVVAKARELGELRHTQHASVHQLLREYDLLRSILETFVLEHGEQLGDPNLIDVIRCLRRINQAVAILTQTTVDTFVERYTATIEQQTRRLEQFNHMISHELRQPLAVLQTAAALLRQTDDPERRGRVVSAVERNVVRLVELLATITDITRLKAADDTKPGVQRVPLATVAHEAARRLREMAEDRQVQIRVSHDLPAVTVDIGRLELIFTNLLSNAIKYSDPAKSERFVEVSPTELTSSACVFQVRDNGIGMSLEEAQRIFTPFYRGHSEGDVEGIGLGLSIVRECAQAIGASIDVDSAVGEGTTFRLTMPVGVCAQ